ncbi:glutamate synthase (NADPH) small subunit [Rubellimicrobium thermophilum DSM 16684]|uniref:Glutamate synthase (NADPH) small subunit n=1 Tax=Rubellimicrobium thermophilum DSM 16684 TaxID=1123069 RepID=S9QT53_9RHOB|nr:NAD(P)-dependent oxidoreductase [Rubellimicrobium thermophilum]EPX84526.1 glutamate synthase (NADPH) small subunit [Rubellimicrobium thermophilum DSM 16684]
MAERMLKFVTLGRAMPEKREAEERRHDFREIYADFARAKAAEQASRCSQCGVPYCQTHCPLHNNIPDWLRMTAEGRLEEAYEIAQSTNSFPEICGRICPQDRLCEGHCVIEQAGHGTVTIGAIERFITDTAWEEGWVRPPRPLRERSESVGIIGSGPAGLACADMLRRAGVQVTVYDRADRAGGLLTYGIPGFKLEKDVVMRRIAQLQEGGVEFVLGCEVGRDLSFDAIRGRHDAVLIATGVYRAREIEGANAPGILPALDYLTASNRKGFGDEVPAFDDGHLNARGKRVIVIGGGDTAMDCVRTAIRQGAASVRCLYRRDRANMPGSQREVANAEEEGVEFVWLAAPAGFLTDPATGAVRAVRVERMRLGAPDASGRRMPEPSGEISEEPADLVIKALGFEPEDLPRLWGVPGLEVTRWGTVRAEFGTGRTNIEGVFAAGDIVRGASLVVWAIRDGREAAAAILRYLAQSETAPRIAAE